MHRGLVDHGVSQAKACSRRPGTIQRADTPKAGSLVDRNPATQEASLSELMASRQSSRDLPARDLHSPQENDILPWLQLEVVGDVHRRNDEAQLQCQVPPQAP